MKFVHLADGAWFDPSNAVVQFNQNLRGDLFERLLETEKEAEMVMCVGTSLSGMNADRVVSKQKKRKETFSHTSTRFILVPNDL